jgi:flavin reductase (DIM6/NTAB) family NADH-FMN oxidoreductase RutF
MSRVEIDRQSIGFPMPVAVLGTRYKGRPNFMAVAWLTRVSFKPPQIAVAVGRSHASAVSIVSNGCFSLSFPNRQQLVATDYVGLVSGSTVDKSAVFPVFLGEQHGAPMAANCPVTMECRLAASLELPTSTLFVGEVVKVYTDEEYMSEGTVDLRKTDPLLLSMPDNHYWPLGAVSIGKAWSAGRSFPATTEATEKGSYDGKQTISIAGTTRTT